MKRDIPLALLNALDDEMAVKALFMEMFFSETLRFSSLDINYYLYGNLYVPEEIQLSGMSMNSGFVVDSVSIMFGNAESALASVLFAANQRGKWVRIRAVALEQNGLLIGSHTVFYGMLSDYKMTAESVRLDLVSWVALWRKKPIRVAEASCPWAFKSTECGYAGNALRCNKTYDRCTALSNTDNFGGDPFLPMLEETPIPWGREMNK